MVAAVSDLYRGLVGIVCTKEGSTKPLPMEVGVFQGDPLSVIIFNTVMNTLVHTITQSHHHLSYSLSSANQSCNLLQFADDTSLLGKGPAACQALLDNTECRHLKQWTGLAKSANTSCLFLPKSMGGLQLPLISTIYKKLQCAKAASLMSSRDPLVRHLASQKTLAEASTVRQSFKPYQQVVEVLREDPGASQKAIVARAKSAVVQAHTQVHFEQCSKQVVQGHTMRQFQDRAAEL